MEQGEFAVCGCARWDTEGFAPGASILQKTSVEEVASLTQEVTQIGDTCV